MKCNDVHATLSSLMFLALYRQIFPLIEDWLSPSQRGQLQAEPCTAVAQPAATEMTCGSAVIIFTDFKPADLWTIPALFKQANSLQCSPQQYPIKALFSGGGYNSDLSRNALIRYLLYLRKENIVPNHFAVAYHVFLGPTDLDYLSAHERNWGWDFYHPKLRELPNAGPLQDPLTSALAGMESFRSIITKFANSASTGRPILVALRPIFEFVICWVGVFQLALAPNATLLPFKPEYREKIDVLGWESSKFQFVLDALAHYHVLLPEVSNHADGLGDFYDKMISSDSVALHEKAVVMETVFREIPEKVMVVDRKVMLGVSRTTHERSNLFTSKSQSELYGHFRSGASDPAATTLRELVLNHTEKENNFAKANLEVQLALITENDASIRGLFWYLNLLTKDLAKIEDTTGPIKVEKRKVLRTSLAEFKSYVSIRMMQARLPGTSISTAQNIIADWIEIAPFTHTRIDTQYLLIPFLLDPQANVVKSSLLPRQYSGLDEDGNPMWGPISNGSALTGSVWITNHASDEAEVKQRQAQLREQLHQKYKTVFDKI